MVLVAARKTAKEMNELYGDNVWEKFFDLEEAAWKRSAYREYIFWKLIEEYVRDERKRGRKQC